MNRNFLDRFTAAWSEEFLAWLLFVFGLAALLAVLNANLDPNFWFVPYPPVPPGAVHVQYLGGGSMPGSRMIHFETDQPAEVIRQFYREELPKRGWQWSCAPTRLEQAGCPLGLSPEEELADAFQRRDDPAQVQAIDVSVSKPGEPLANSQNRLVEIIQYRYPLPTP